MIVNHINNRDNAEVGKEMQYNRAASQQNSHE